VTRFISQNNSIQSFYLYTDPILPNPPFFTIPEDSITQIQEKGLWNPFPLLRPEQKLQRDTGFKAHSELFKILFEYLRIRNPSSSATDKGLMFYNATMLHQKMLQWADDLPPELVRGPESLPMVLDLQ
jgi:hypothetical protein